MNYDDLTPQARADYENILKDNADLRTQIDYLQDQIEQFNYVCKLYEKQLQVLMLDKEYAAFQKQCAADLFRKQVEAMEDGEFKQFCMDLVRQGCSGIPS